jgi:hypothetical protein
VRLKWDGISRAHAWIDLPREAATGTCELVCNGSGNGTFLNGFRVSRCWLSNGDVIGFGHGHDVAQGARLDHAALVYELVFRSSLALPHGPAPPWPAPALDAARAPDAHQRRHSDMGWSGGRARGLDYDIGINVWGDKGPAWAEVGLGGATGGKGVGEERRPLRELDAAPNSQSLTPGAVGLKGHLGAGLSEQWRAAAPPAGRRLAPPDGAPAPLPAAALPHPPPRLTAPPHARRESEDRRSVHGEGGAGQGGGGGAARGNLQPPGAPLPPAAARSPPRAGGVEVLLCRARDDGNEQQHGVFGEGEATAEAGGSRGGHGELGACRQVPSREAAHGAWLQEEATVEEEAVAALQACRRRLREVEEQLEAARLREEDEDLRLIAREADKARQQEREEAQAAAVAQLRSELAQCRDEAARAAQAHADEVQQLRAQAEADARCWRRALVALPHALIELSAAAVHAALASASLPMA